MNRESELTDRGARRTREEVLKVLEKGPSRMDETAQLVMNELENFQQYLLDYEERRENIAGEYMDTMKNLLLKLVGKIEYCCKNIQQSERFVGERWPKLEQEMATYERILENTKKLVRRDGD